MKGTKILAAFVSAALALGACIAPAYASYTTDDYTGITRDDDNISTNRGLVAVKVSNGVFLSWRLFGNEDVRFGTSLYNVTFNVYKNGELIAEKLDNTNYVDTSGTTSDVYTVEPVGGGVSGSATVQTNQYFDIPMQVPDDVTLEDGVTYSYAVGDCSTGDVDGDGEFEIIVKWDCNAQDNSNGGYTGNVLLDAYKLDGTFLWRVDLGRNVRGGAHYTQFLVYDYDGDGKAEMICQTAPGSMDGNGKYVSAASSDSDILAVDNTAVYINDGGYNISGDEFLTVFDGETGAAIDTIYYPAQRIDVNVWGDSYGNRCDRFVGDVAYLDGENPYAVYVRGYYFRQSGKGYSERMTVCAVRFDGEKLISEYCFDTFDADSYSGKSSSTSYRSDGTYKGVNGYKSGYEDYVGQGNHNMTAADVDNDGKDEIITGALCVEMDDDYNIVPKWCTFLGHGDAMHIGDYDPTHAGYEFFTVHEEEPYGESVIDAETGEIMFHEDGSSDTGRGMMANTGAGGYYQFWSAKNNTYQADGGTTFTSSSVSKGSQNFRIFWDGDLYDELLDGTTITSYNASGSTSSSRPWENNSWTTILSASDCTSVNGTKANPGVQADIFGDWREEVVYPLSDSSALRVYTTTTETDYKIKSLMTDTVYRSGVAAEQSSYNQPPHIGFYLAESRFEDSLSLLVKDASGAALAGAEVTIDGTAYTSDADGYVNIDISAGTYIVSAAYDGVTAMKTVFVLNETEDEITVDDSISYDWHIERNGTTFTALDADTASIDVTAANSGLTAIAAVYSDGALVYTTSAELDGTVSLTGFDEITFDENAEITVKVFVWSNLDTLVPVTDAVEQTF